ncbi:MAG: hypothetical protein ACE5G2_12175 [Candidatus Krumholzibacteriia bacterium]
MHPEERLEGRSEERHLTRWLPSALLDLPPLEPVFALRTPHRVCLQSMPSSRHVLRTLLQRWPFEITVELDTEEAPLRHVPIHDVHEARLTPDRPLEWNHYYWIIDGLQEDLHAWSEDPAAALARGRRRLDAVELTLRELRRGARCDLSVLQEVWAEKQKAQPEQLGYPSEPMQTLQQYVRGLTGHLIEHASSRAFADWARDLLEEAERRPGLGLPQLSADDRRVLGLYLQHRLLGCACLTAPSGMIAGWHVLISSAVLAMWYAGLLVQCGHETDPDEALFASLWMLDQGFWCDESLVHDVLHNLNASEYTSVDLATALTTAMRGAHSRT